MAWTRASEVLDRDLWIWSDRQRIHIVAARPGTDEVVLSRGEAFLAAFRLFAVCCPRLRLPSMSG